MRSLLLVALCLTLGCKKGEASKESGAAETSTSAPDLPRTAAASAAAPSAEARLFDKAEVRGRLCDLLTAAQIAAVAKVDASSVKLRKLAGHCLYEWAGGKVLLKVDAVTKTAEGQKSRFEQAYRNQTPEEVKADLAAVQARLAEKHPDKAQAGKALTNPLADSMSEGLSFEPVSGIGDQAMFETTRHSVRAAGKEHTSFANKLAVRVGNLSFTVSYDPGGPPKIYKTETLALGKAVVLAL